MKNKAQSIPVKQIAEVFENGIVVGQIPPDMAPYLEVETELAHRHDAHFFALHERGEMEMEIDFERYKADTPSLLYIHPNQVHRLFQVGADVVAYILAIGNESISAQYLTLLEEITPTKPIQLDDRNFTDLRQAMLLCISLFERKKDRLYDSILKESCNAFIGLIISQYLESSAPADKLSRFDMVTRAFKVALGLHFLKKKRPADYANELNISIAYLNECVKNTTGLSVSQHIQQRLILEAKRLLYHSNKSIKEIAIELGYDDYAYFSRLFKKASGMTALTFRNKNRD
ncbi:AraC family transcriptional regulator [Pedobacter sp. MC2016-24]|uniref:helix-turn-helix domain-containing protein n=1 Tax=Pedobacter sp. MC2016-24 TaxID=2780090 RepID=UPI00188094B5|nr:helix-turn-helix transcriptional regulator [Pedobacter sp. MC2016-24]MBE9600753.1 helix-turn-helix domain-containing protein [Pedobacter sp. MC2016-24]